MFVKGRKELLKWFMTLVEFPATLEPKQDTKKYKH